MDTATENIRLIGSTDSIDELNKAYNEAVLQTQRYALAGGFDGCGMSVSEILATLNHIANYNIVRVANGAYERWRQGNCTDNGCLITISVCRDSLKEHEDVETERGLLDNLCEELEIA